MDIEKILAQMPIFAGSPMDQLQRIGRHVRPCTKGKGEMVFRKGAVCEGFYLLLEGQVKIAFHSSEGNEKVVEIIGRGQAFGEALMFSEAPMIVYGQALSDCRLLCFPKETIFDELARDTRLAHRMLSSVSLQVHQLMSDLESYTLQSAKQRIIDYLLRSVPKDAGASRQIVTLEVNKSVIASRLNLTKEHFSRTLHGLLERGLIAIEGRRVHINDVQQLRMQMQAQ